MIAVLVAQMYDYFKAILGFVGITDVQFAYAKGIGWVQEGKCKAQRSAK